MPRLVVVLPLVPLSVGVGFPLRTWPLHVTVAPTFVTGAEAAAIAAVIAPVVAGTPTVTVTAGDDEGFGPSGRVPVTVLVPSPELSQLHEVLLAALRAVGVEFDDPVYTGPGYRAHVTVTGDARMRPGETALLEQAALVDMEPVGPDRCRHVLWASPLLSSGQRCPGQPSSP
jgi:2'-5' RNA ligase